ncbi:nitrite/sulfite reductase [Micromonospora sp. M12]
MVGRVSGAQLSQLADVVEAHGSDRVRLTPYQKLLVLDVPSERTESLVDALRGIGLEARPSAWRRGTMACTGIEYCKLAIVETKARGEELVARLEQRLADFDADISIHINGCPNACARTQVADIGLRASWWSARTAGTSRVSRCTWAAGWAWPRADRRFRPQAAGLKTTADELPEYVERLARRYLAGRSEGETFANWVIRVDEEALR